MNWNEVFVPTDSLLEVVVRGTIMYLALFFAMRFLLKRHAGELGLADILVIVLVSEAAQNALVGEAKSVTEAFLLVGTILFWSFALNWLSYHYPVVARLTGAGPLQLVKDGRMNLGNMRRELITKDELMSQLREQGIDDLAKVKSACLEGDGSFSVIRKDDGEVTGPPARSRAA